MAKAKKSNKAKAGARRAPKVKAPETTEVVVSPQAPEPTKTDAAPSVRDERLPDVGTKIEKRDRHGEVRCTCTVVEDGVRYDGTTYKSISAAAMAAAKDLGLKNKTQNGFTFWGLSKPPRPATDPVEALQRAWTRYHGRVKAAVAATTDENRDAVQQELAKQSKALAEL